jgi:hypothetical protein
VSPPDHIILVLEEAKVEGEKIFSGRIVPSLTGLYIHMNEFEKYSLKLRNQLKFSHVLMCRSSRTECKNLRQKFERRILNRVNLALKIKSRLCGLVDLDGVGVKT